MSAHYLFFGSNIVHAKQLEHRRIDNATVHLVDGASARRRILANRIPNFGGEEYERLEHQTTYTGDANDTINDTPTGTSDTSATVLQPGTTYYWEVHARGNWYGTWSSIYSFTTAARC